MLQILCVTICALLPVLALHLIGYVAIGGWHTYWAYDIWVYLCAQMLIYLEWMIINLVLFCRITSTEYRHPKYRHNENTQ
jgi:hypothetical protein